MSNRSLPLAHKIPDELKANPHWIVWSKRTKLPWRVRDDRFARSNDPASWAAFSEALAIVKDHPDTLGLGYAFVKNDPYTFIDLDEPQDDATRALQSEILRTYEYHGTYIERSNSGKGYHIICRGTIPAAYKHNGIEMYNCNRFCYLTGDCITVPTIKECSHTTIKLYDDLNTNRKGNDVDLSDVVSLPQLEQDDDLLNKLFRTEGNTAHGMQIFALYHANELALAKYADRGKPGVDASAVDQALMNHIVFVTDNMDQALRILLDSPWAKVRDNYSNNKNKLARRDYLTRTWERANDNKVRDALLRVNMNFTTSQPVPAAAVVDPVISVPPKVVEGLDWPPGVMGDIARYVYGASMYPRADIACCAGIALMAAICGREYYINDSGLSQYLIVIGPPSSGKTAAHDGIGAIHSAMRHSDGTNILDVFLGTGRLASAQAINTLLATHPSTLIRWDEMGGQVQAFTCPKPVGSDVLLLEALTAVFSQNKPTGRLLVTARADRNNNSTEVRAPALSIFGLTVPHMFYKYGVEAIIHSGFLGRMLIFEFDVDKYNAVFTPARKVPDHLIAGINNIVDKVLELRRVHQFKEVVYNSEAREYAIQRVTEIDAKRSGGRNVVDSAKAALLGRVFEKTQRLAGLVAVSANADTPVVDMQCFKWAESFVNMCADSISHRIENPLPTFRQVQRMNRGEKVLAYMREWLKFTVEERVARKVPAGLAEINVVPYRAIASKFAPDTTFGEENKTLAQVLQAELQHLVEQEIIARYPDEDVKKRGGRITAVSVGYYYIL